MSNRESGVGASSLADRLEAATPQVERTSTEVLKLVEQQQRRVEHVLDRAVLQHVQEIQQAQRETNKYDRKETEHSLQLLGALYRAKAERILVTVEEFTQYVQTITTVGASHYTLFPKVIKPLLTELGMRDGEAASPYFSAYFESVMTAQQNSVLQQSKSRYTSELVLPLLEFAQEVGAVSFLREQRTVLWTYADLLVRQSTFGHVDLAMKVAVGCAALSKEDKTMDEFRQQLIAAALANTKQIRDEVESGNTSDQKAHLLIDCLKQFAAAQATPEQIAKITQPLDSYCTTATFPSLPARYIAMLKKIGHLQAAEAVLEKILTRPDVQDNIPILASYCTAFADEGLWSESRELTQYLEMSTFNTEDLSSVTALVANGEYQAVAEEGITEVHHSLTGGSIALEKAAHTLIFAAERAENPRLFWYQQHSTSAENYVLHVYAASPHLFERTMRAGIEMEEHIELCSLLGDSETLQHVKQELLQPDLKQDRRFFLIGQLAYLLYQVPPIKTQFWLESGTVDTSCRTEQHIEQTVDEVRRICTPDSQTDSIFFDKRYRAALAVLSHEYKVITQASKLQYIDTAVLIRLAEMLSDAQTRRFADQLGKFMKRVLNSFPSASVQGVLWCMVESVQTGSQDTYSFDTIYDIDWTDPGEQACITSAAEDLGSISPLVFQRYRKLWWHARHPELEVESERSSASILNKGVIKRLLGVQSEDEFSEYKLQEFVAGMQRLKQEFFKNTPIQKILEERNIDQSVLAEYIFTFFKPVGMTFSEVEIIINRLLPQEEQLVAQVSAAGLEYAPRQVAVVSSEMNYTLVAEQAVFDTRRRQATAAIREIDTQFSAIMVKNDRYLGELCEYLEVGSLSEGMQKKLYSLLQQAHETTGIWWQDNRQQAYREQFVSPENQVHYDAVFANLHDLIETLLAFFEAEERGENDATQHLVPYLSKNCASFFAKAAVGLCTARDVPLFVRPDHFHLNVVDPETVQVVANMQLYTVSSQEYFGHGKEPTDQSLLIRGLNPSTQATSSENAKSWVDLFFEEAARIAQDSGLDAVYMVEPANWHPDSNRPEIRRELYHRFSELRKVRLDKPFPIRRDDLESITCQNAYLVWSREAAT